MRRPGRTTPLISRDRLWVQPTTVDVALRWLRDGAASPAEGPAGIEPVVEPAVDLAGLVATDPALAAVVLRAANSVHLGFTRQIGSVRRATVMLGAQSVTALIGGRVADLLFARRDPAMPEWYWSHSLVVANAAAVLARHCRQPVEEAYAAGLLHDIGWLLAASNDVQLERNDRAHATLAGELLGRWNLPDAIVEAASSHHRSPDATTSPTVRLVVAAHSVAAEMGAPEGDERARPVRDALRSLGIDVRPEAIVGDVERAVTAAAAVLRPPRSSASTDGPRDEQEVGR